jgi:hypothetical protein
VSVTVSHALPYLARIWHGPASDHRLSGGTVELSCPRVCGGEFASNCRACPLGCHLGYEANGGRISLPKPFALARLSHSQRCASYLVVPSSPVGRGGSLLPFVLQVWPACVDLKRAPQAHAFEDRDAATDDAQVRPGPALLPGAVVGTGTRTVTTATTNATAEQGRQRLRSNRSLHRVTLSSHLRS